MPPLIASVLAIAAGASLGAICRWVLGVALNGLFPALPPGTLVANLLGGYLIGLALGSLAGPSGLPPEWRLFVVTGFLGSLTTFSSFSAEVVTLMQQGRLAWAATAVCTHVIGSLLATLAGLGSWHLLFGRAAG